MWGPAEFASRCLTWDEDNNIEAAGGGMVDLVQWGLTNWP
jgi:hypothetical protein